MVVWRNVVKGVIKASLPIIVLPATAIGVVIYYFGFTLDSLVAMLFLGEVYIIWAQLEVALRQTRLSVLEYEPELRMKVQETTLSFNGHHVTTFHVKLKNVGEHLARNILITGKVELTGTEACPPKYIGDVAPNEEVEVYDFKETSFNDSRITIEVNYDSMLGESGGLTFVKDPRFPQFLVARSMRMPGILLNSLEELMLILRLVTLPRRIRKIQERQQK